MNIRIGFGYDIHKLIPQRDLLLGGVKIDSPVGEEGHSDADVLIHAIIDALLGAASLGDIGSHFPPSDAQYKDISSRILLKKVHSLIKEIDFTIINIDSTIILEKPKIQSYSPRIKVNLAQDLNLNQQKLSVKAKTKEGIGQVGRGLAIEAYAVVLLSKNHR